MANNSEIKIIVSGDSSDATQALDKVQKELGQTAQAGKKAGDAVNDAFKNLGIQSSKQIQQTRKTLVDSFLAIKKSGSSSAEDVAKAYKALGTQLRKLDGDAERASKQMQKVEKSMSKASKMSGKLKAGIAGLAAGVSIGAITNLVREVVNLGDSIGKTADAFGISTDFLQEFRFIAERTGVSIQSADASLARFSKRIGEASLGTGAAAKAYEMLGISLKDSEGNLKSNRTILLEVADAIDGLGSSSQKAAAVAAIFGREGIKLINTFKGGSNSIKELANEFSNLGGGVSEGLIRKSEEIADKMTNIDAAATKVKSELVLAFSDEIIGGMERMVVAISDLNGFLQQNQGFVSGVSSSFNHVVGLIETFIKLGALAEKAWDFLFFFPKKAFDFIGGTVSDFINWASGADNAAKATDDLASSTNDLGSEIKTVNEAVSDDNGIASMGTAMEEVDDTTDNLIKKFQDLNKELDFEAQTEGWTAAAKAEKQTADELTEIINKYSQVPGLVEAVTEALNKQHEAAKAANAELAEAANVEVDKAIAESANANAFERVAAEERVRDAAIKAAEDKREELIKNGADEVNAFRKFELEKQEIIAETQKKISNLLETQQKTAQISGTIGFGESSTAGIQKLQDTMNNVANSASRFAESMQTAEEKARQINKNKLGQSLSVELPESLALERNLRIAGRGTMMGSTSIDELGLGPGFGVQSIVPMAIQEESRRMGLQEAIQTGEARGASQEQIQGWVDELRDEFGITGVAGTPAQSVDNSVNTTNVFNVATSNVADFRASQKQLTEDASRSTEAAIRRQRRSGIMAGSR